MVHKIVETTLLLGLLHYFATECKAKTNFFSRTLLLRTRAITDTKSSPEGVRNNGS